MRYYPLGAFLAAVALIVAGVTYNICDPRSKANGAQQEILEEYLSAYCRLDPLHSKDFQAGEMAVLSRLTIATGIGTLALAEYAKCKVTL